MRGRCCSPPGKQRPPTVSGPGPEPHLPAPPNPQRDRGFRSGTVSGAVEVPRARARPEKGLRPSARGTGHSSASGVGRDPLSSAHDTRSSSCLVFGVWDGEPRPGGTLTSVEGHGGRAAAGRVSDGSPRPRGVTRGGRSPHVLLSPPRPSESMSPVLGARRGAGPGAHREEALSVPSKSPQPSEILSHEPQIASQQDDMWRETLGRGWGYAEGAPTSWGQGELGKATRRR